MLDTHHHAAGKDPQNEELMRRAQSQHHTCFVFYFKIMLVCFYKLNTCNILQNTRCVSEMNLSA